MTRPVGSLLKKADGQPNDFFVELVPQIREGAMPDELNERAAAKLGQRLHKKHHQQRDGNDGPDVVDAVREKVIQVKRGPP